MPRSTKPPVDPTLAPLKRLGGGRWQTRDERFTIEPQSGTWVIVDAEQTDDFGMALVRGPFPSLTAAKDAIASARSSGPATSPLVDQIERRRRQPERESTPKPTAKPTTTAASPRSSAKELEARKTGSSTTAPKAATRDRKIASPDEEPREPGWLTDLAPAERGRARRLIARLEEDGVSDAEGLVRRDVVGDVPALASAAIAKRLRDLGDDATPTEVADLLADGRDERLAVRWRLVDGEGRPILLDHGSRRGR
jgi:hypothetical protein